MIFDHPLNTDGEVTNRLSCMGDFAEIDREDDAVFPEALGDELVAGPDDLRR